MGVCNNKVTRQWKTKYEMYEESTQDRRESASLLENNTKPDTPAGSASCEHHVLVDAIIVERLKVWRWLRFKFLTERAEDEIQKLYFTTGRGSVERSISSLLRLVVNDFINDCRRN